MRSRNPVYPLPQLAFCVHINSDDNQVSRCKSYSWMETGLNRRETFSFGAMSSPNIPNLAKARQELPLPDSGIGSSEPFLLLRLFHHYDSTPSSYLNSVRYREDATRKKKANKKPVSHVKLSSSHYINHFGWHTYF